MLLLLCCFTSTVNILATLFLGRLRPPYFVHILSPVTDNCPSWISRRNESMWPDRVSNPGPLTYQSGTLPTALRGPTSVSWRRALDKREYLVILRDNFCLFYKKHRLWPLIWTVSMRRFRWGVTTYGLNEKKEKNIPNCFQILGLI